MPTYDYVCKTCGKQFEYFQSITAEKLTRCPREVCEQEAKGRGLVDRKIGTGAGVIFTGSGFYETDYVRKSDNAAKSTSSSSTSDQSGGTSSKETSKDAAGSSGSKSNSKGDASS